MNKYKIKHTQLLVIASVITLLAIASSLYIIYGRSSESEHTKPDTPKSGQTIEVKTYPAATEGQTVQIPDNVSSSSIKDYTLITDNEEFKIRELNGDYTITLYAIINRPDQADAYHDQLREYKKNALVYLSDHGTNINKVDITYEPAEAKDL